MKNILFLFFLLISSPLFAQPVSTIDFMKTVDNNREELIYYYENNWKVFRDIALERGFIDSYQLMTTQSDSTANFDIILITTYSDQKEFEQAEDRFQEIIKELDEKRGGIKLLNNLKPIEFRSRVFSKNATTIFSASNLQD